MSHLSAFVDCPNIQVGINAAFPVCIKPEITPFLNFLISSENVKGVLQKSISPGADKLRTVEVRYSQRIPESEVSEVASHNCTATTKRGETSTTYDLDENDGVKVEELIDLNDLRRRCESNSDWLMERIAALLDAYHRKLATKIVGQAVLLTGEFADGDNDVVAAVKTVSTKFSDQTIDEDLLSEVEFSAMNSEFCGGTFGFGYGEFTKYFRRLLAGCCSNQGLDMGELNRQFGISVANDRRIVDATNGFGANHFVIVQSGALQLLHWTQYGDPVAQSNDDTFVTREIIHPALGIPVDFLMKKDCDLIHLIIRSADKLVGLPTDLYHPGDRLEGVTKFLEFQIVNP